MATDSAAVVVGLDENYLAAAQALLRSIRRCRRAGGAVRVIALTSARSYTAVARLCRALSSDRLHAEACEVRADLRGLPLAHYLTDATYLRLLAPSSCPDIDRALYLDSDTVVLQDVDELLYCDLGGAPVGAVRDLGNPSLGRLARLAPCCGTGGVDPSDPYFNSGVLVMDLTAWRREAISERVIDLLHQCGRWLRFLDQDAVNLILAGQWHKLDQRWNVFPFRELFMMGRMSYRAEEVMPLSALTQLRRTRSSSIT